MKDCRITSSTPMRVCGYCAGMPGGGRKFDDFGFSPSANLIVRGASATGHSETGCPHFHFTICDWPPIGLAEPCSTSAVVVPPASWWDSWVLGGWGGEEEKNPRGRGAGLGGGGGGVDVRKEDRVRRCRLFFPSPLPTPHSLFIFHSHFLLPVNGNVPSVVDTVPS